MCLKGKKMERDWKTFKNMIPHLRERYLKSKNYEIIKILQDENKNQTERFWSARDKFESERKILVDCLDGYSRSRMLLHLALMYRYKMLKEDDLNEFSEELRNKIMNIN